MSEHATTGNWTLGKIAAAGVAVAGVLLAGLALLRNFGDFRRPPSREELRRAVAEALLQIEKDKRAALDAGGTGDGPSSKVRSQPDDGRSAEHLPLAVAPVSDVVAGVEAPTVAAAADAHQNSAPDQRSGELRLRDEKGAAVSKELQNHATERDDALKRPSRSKSNAKDVVGLDDETVNENLAVEGQRLRYEAKLRAAGKLPKSAADSPARSERAAMSAKLLGFRTRLAIAERVLEQALKAPLRVNERTLEEVEKLEAYEQKVQWLREEIDGCRAGIETAGKALEVLDAERSEAGIEKARGSALTNPDTYSEKKTAANIKIMGWRARLANAQKALELAEKSRPVPRQSNVTLGGGGMTSDNAAELLAYDNKLLRLRREIEDCRANIAKLSR